MSFKVIKAGFLSTIQDYGRFNYARYGISQCGALDEHSFCWANYLLDNNFNDAVIEITFGDVCIEAQADTFIVVTGADINFKINAKIVKLYCCIKIKKNDLLTWGLPKIGVRAYLAIKGGFNVPKVFASSSVNLRENIGFKLQDGDNIACNTYTDIKYRFMIPRYIPDYNKNIVLRLLPTYQFSEFSSSQKKSFFQQTYTISNANDRSGCCLNGIAINTKKQTMISEGISYGSVEITNDGMPIILLKDAPTIGGYSKIGTVFSLDLSKLAQKQANAKLKFKLMDIALAQKKRMEFNSFFRINQVH